MSTCMPASNKVYDMGLGVYPICIQIEYIMYIILNSKDEILMNHCVVLADNQLA